MDGRRALRWVLVPVAFVAALFLTVMCFLAPMSRADSHSPEERAINYVFSSLFVVALSYVIMVATMATAPSRRRIVGAMAAAAYSILAVLLMERRYESGYLVAAQVAMLALMYLAALETVELAGAADAKDDGKIA